MDGKKRRKGKIRVARALGWAWRLVFRGVGFALGMDLVRVGGWNGVLRDWISGGGEAYEVLLLSRMSEDARERGSD